MMVTRIKTPKEVTAMRESGKILANILQIVKNQTRVGLSTKDLSKIAKSELSKTKGTPTFLGYRGYPDVICISINDEIVHGIPRADKIIVDGDIVSLDFGVTYDGMITDGAISFIVGTPKSRDDQVLVEATLESLYRGIAVVKNGATVGDIGFAVAEVLNRHHYGIVRDLVGHGVGHHLHEIPNIPNYGNKNTGPMLSAGMTIAIEPMATLGDYHIDIDNDDWTVRTADKSRSAHFEHTVLITDNGAEILTKA